MTWPDKQLTATSRSIIALLCALLVASLASSGRSAPTFEDSFEGPNPSWKAVGRATQLLVRHHDRVSEIAHSGRSCERLQLSAGHNSELLFRQSIDPSRVIAELAASVWVKSVRPGVRVGTRVVLPRTEDPRTGDPLTTYVWGTAYQQIGSWQQLTATNIPEGLTQQVRSLRQEFGPHVDPREAYVDEILLGVQGGGETTLWIDDLTMSGMVSARTAILPRATSGDGPLALDRSRHLPRATTAVRRTSVEFQGTVLMVDDHAFLPRIVEFQGEPLATLRDLGFNVVRLREFPNRALLSEASRLAMWVVCPPPTSQQLRGEPFGAELERVLAWDLGKRVSESEVSATRTWANSVKRDPVLPKRPILIEATSALDAYSRIADVLLIGRDPLFSSLELVDYARWVGEREQLARPGTPLWARVQSQPDRRLTAQWETLGTRIQPDVPVDQIEHLVALNLCAGAHGLYFASHASLAASDEPTQTRALTLKRVNLTLEMIEPWAAAGSYVTSASASNSINAWVLQTQRARLLIPIVNGAGAQYVLPSADNEPQAYVLPGVPESNDAYALSPVGLQPLRHRRLAGGVHVMLDEPASRAMVVMTQDPWVISTLSQRAAQRSRQAAELQRELAVRQLRTTQNVEQQLDERLGTLRATAPLMAQAQGEVTQCDSLLAAGNWRSAYDHASRALATVGRWQFQRWQQATPSGSSPVATPFGVHFATLPEHYDLMRNIQARALGPEQLPGGDLENLSHLVELGWQHFRHPLPNVLTDVSLAPESPRSGRFCLKIVANAKQPETAKQLIATAPVWVTSPPIHVQAGQLVKIEGWVRVPEPITGSVDGLLIFDSWTGEALAERIGQTNDWQRFTLYRAAPMSGGLTVTFALTGLGEADVDAVSVRTVGSEATAVSNRQ